MKLAMCHGASGEIALSENMDNASIATCKIPAPPSLVEETKEKGWVELPYC